MTHLYLDTSALVKLYVYESGTPQMLELASKADNQLTLSTLTQIEFHSAVRSRQRAGGPGRLGFRVDAGQIR